MSRLRLLAGLLVGAALLAPVAPGLAQNAALGRPVTLTGTYGALRDGSPFDPTEPLAAGSSLTDGLFTEEGRLWNRGTVWWDAAVAGSEANEIIIDLGGVRSISQLFLQADDNDRYDLWYRLDASSTWSYFATAVEVGGGGMRTRSGSFAPFEAAQFRITGAAGDGYYAVSEFQAISTVPEPSTVALVGVGGVSLLLVRRRRARRPA